MMRADNLPVRSRDREPALSQVGFGASIALTAAARCAPSHEGILQVPVGPLGSFAAMRSGQRMSLQGVRREKAALSSGCKPRPATAPAGSNRSRHGGDELSEAFG